MGSLEEAEHLARIRVTELGEAKTAFPPTATFRPSAHPEDQADARDALPRIVLDRTGTADGAPLGPAEFQVRSTIGEGGMGRVHLVRQRSLDRDVAVKTLKGDLRPSAAAALLREARLTGSLEHPGVIPVHALGVDEAGLPLLVMKRVEGVDWRALLERESTTSSSEYERLERNVEILIDVCETLEFAHSRGIVHRDIKPENVMVGRYGEVYLVDWGIATRADQDIARSAFAGTPSTMAPEMVTGEPVDARTDVYLLGATLHEVLTGTPRHDASDLMTALKSAALSKPVSYDDAVPTRLAELCNRATARDRAARPQTARAFADELRGFLRHRTAMSLADAAAERLDDLEAMLRASGPGAPAELAVAYRLGSEARFGFTQCLREHPDFAAADAGLQRCLAALVELELRQEHAESAAALVDEMRAPPRELAERVAKAAQDKRERERETERLRAMAKALDPQGSPALRRAFLGTSVALLVVIAVAVGSGALGDLTPRVLLVVGAFVTAAFSAFYVVLGRDATINTFNRRLGRVAVVAAAGLLLNRGMGVMLDTPVAETLARDLSLFVVASSVVAATVDIEFAWVAAPCLAGAFLIPRFGPYSQQIFSVALMLAVGAAAFILRTRKDRERAP